MIRLRFRKPCLCCVWALVGAHAAHGAWQVVPEISIGIESDDNPRLVDDDTAAELGRDDVASRLLAEARWRLLNSGQRGELAVTPALRTDSYADEVHEDFQSTDGFVRSNGTYRWERALIGFDADFSNERILGSEFLVAEPDDPDLAEPNPTDTVLLGLNERRRRFVLNPYTEVTTGGLHLVRIDARLQDVSYDGDMQTARSDFNEAALGTEYVRRLDARNSLSGGLRVSRFEADRNDNEADTVGIELGFSRDLSEIWSLDLRLGTQRSDTTFMNADALTVTTTQDDATFGLGFRKRSETGRMNIDLQRNVAPDSFGSLVIRNQLRLALLRQMSPTLNGVVAIRAIESENAGGDLAPTDRVFGRLELGLDWSFAELWSLFIKYNHSTRREDLAALSSIDARSNALALGFRYRGRTQP